MLDPIVVPESNRAKGHKEATMHDADKKAVAAANKETHFSHRATGNEFVGGDKTK